MKKLIFYFFLLLTMESCIYCQRGYKKIARTRVSMNLPKGYKMMNASTSIQRDSTQMIMVMDLVGGNFYTNAKDLSANAFKSKGATTYEYTETEVSGYPAKFLITSTDDNNTNGMVLVFGDSTFSTMINGLYNSASKKDEIELKRILFSVKYDKSQKIDPFEGVKFSIDTFSTNFRFLAFSANLYVFTPYGKDNQEDKSTIMLTPIDFDKTMTIESISQMLLNSMKKHGMYGFMTDSTNKYKIDDYDAMLTIGDCFAKIERFYYYELVLVKEDLCLSIFSFCDYNNESRKKEIDLFCKNIRLTN